MRNQSYLHSRIDNYTETWHFLIILLVYYRVGICVQACKLLFRKTNRKCFIFPPSHGIPPKWKKNWWSEMCVGYIRLTPTVPLTTTNPLLRYQQIPTHLDSIAATTTLPPQHYHCPTTTTTTTTLPPQHYHHPTTTISTTTTTTTNYLRLFLIISKN